MVTKISGTEGVTAPAVTSVGSIKGGDYNIGIIGACRKLRAYCKPASASLQFLANELVLATGINGQLIRLTMLNQTINLATVGANGMDVGQAPVSGFVAVYAIYNPTTKAVALLAQDCSSVYAEQWYTGANMPAGYTYSALISVWPTDSNRLFMDGRQDDRDISVTKIITMTSNIPTSPLKVTPPEIPHNAVCIYGQFSAQYASGSGIFSLAIAANEVGVGQQGLSGTVSTAGQGWGGPYRIQLADQSTFWIWSSGSSTVATLLYLRGYTI